MSTSPTATRTDRRRLKTRAALIAAAQRLLAEGRPNVPVLEITQLADVGLGSFYNHFVTKDELYRAALQDVLDQLGGVLDRLTADLDDAAVTFATSFRLTGRLFRYAPQLSRVVLRSSVDLMHTDVGLAARARRDLSAGVAAGRFDIADLDLAVSLAAGALIALGVLLEQQPGRDDTRAADALAHDLLRLFGLPAQEAAEICRLPLPDLASVAP